MKSYRKVSQCSRVVADIPSDNKIVRYEDSQFQSYDNLKSEVYLYDRYYSPEL